MNCRHCGAPLEHLFLDLGYAPPSNAYLNPSHLSVPETYFPLRVFVCDQCWLVQTEDFAEASLLFNDEYAYFSSISDSWLRHAELYCDHILERLQLDENAFVVEIASNDGYLLKNFVARGINCLGIEPTQSTAEQAEAIGVPTLREFFSEALGQQLASEEKKADLVVGNNVYAHVPDINDFTRGISRLLNQDGVVTLEFPHLLRLIEETQFDTIYHEHFSYLSLGVVQQVFAAAGLRIFDVEELKTHGGSLRVYGCRSEACWEISTEVERIVAEENTAGLTSLATYKQFQSRVESVKDQFLSFLLEVKREGKLVLGYGAAAKGNTLINFSGVKPDLLPAVCDAAPSKVGKLLPGSHIPIVSPEEITRQKPDYVLILPWNLANEIKGQLHQVSEWGAKFVTAVPELNIQP